MKKTISILLSLITISIVIFGISQSLSFSEWIPVDIGIAVILLINGLVFSSIGNKNEKININYIMLGIGVLAFIIHSKYSIWILIDIGIIIGSTFSIISVIRIKNANKEIK